MLDIVFGCQLDQMDFTVNSEFKAAANSRFAKAAGSVFYDNEVLNSSFVLLMKFNAEKNHLRKAAKH